EKWTRCLSLYESAGCNVWDTQIPELRSACDGAFQGTVPVGQTCFSSAECADRGECSQGTCNPEASCCPGVCTGANRTVSIGGDCSKDNCTSDAYCKDRKCTPRVDLGKSCDSDESCVRYGTCSATTGGVCIGPALDGAACTEDLGCASLLSYCDSVEH